MLKRKEKFCSSKASRPFHLKNTAFWISGCLMTSLNDAISPSINVLGVRTQICCLKILTKSWDSENAPSPGTNSQLFSENPKWATPPEWGMQNCLNYPCPVYLGGLQEKLVSEHLPNIPLVQFSTNAFIQTQCSSGRLLKHFTWSKDFSTVLKLLCNLVLNSASALLEVPLHLVQLLLTTLQHWLMAGVANEEGEDGLAVEEHVENQVDIKQVEAYLVTWPATSPTKLATSEPSEVGWRCTVKRAPSFEWGHSLREMYFDRVQNSFNPSNLFIVVRPKDC